MAWRSWRILVALLALACVGCGGVLGTAPEELVQDAATVEAGAPDGAGQPDATTQVDASGADAAGDTMGDGDAAADAYAGPADSSGAPDVASADAGDYTLLVNVRVLGPVSGLMLSSSPAGIACTGPCTQSVNVTEGSTVTLTAAASGGLVGWGANTGCSGSTCSIVVSGSMAVTVTFSGNNLVFVTSTTHDGNLGGAAGADAICNEDASKAGLPGSYVAWIGTLANNPLTRLGSARGWVRPDGLPFADTVAGLENGQIYYPPAVNELGQPQYDSFVYTGANVDGSVVLDSMGQPSGNCTNFTSNAATAPAYGGSSGGGTWVWTSGVSEPCSGQAPIYCFGTDLTNPVAIAPASGRHAFLSTGNFTPSAGLGSADTLCQSEATSANLANAQAFLAMLATTSTGAASRFNLGGANWVRTDGIPITSTPSDVEHSLLAGISVHADGTYAGNTTVTGAFSPPPIASGADDTATAGTSDGTCSSWTTTTGYLMTVAWAGYTASWFRFTESSCNLPLPVFCFEN